MDFYAKMKQARENIKSNFDTIPKAYHDDLLEIPEQLLLMGFVNNDKLPRTFGLELTYSWKPEELKKILEEVIDIEVESVTKSKDHFYLHSNHFSVRIKN